MSSSNNTTSSSNANQMVHDDEFDLRRMARRVFPYLPLTIILLAVSITIAFLYLRYSTPIYSIKTRVIVNDDVQEKGTNLLESINANFRDVDRATEKEVEIIKSKGIINQVVKKLQLNVEWGMEGRVKMQPKYENLPIEIILLNPDSVLTTYTGDVEIIDDKKILFNGQTYFFNEKSNTEFGQVVWLQKFKYNKNATLNLTINPISKTVSKYKSALSATTITRQSSIVDIALKDAIPERAKDFLNTLLEVYGENSINHNTRIFQNTINFIDERLALVADELGTVEDKLQKFKSQEGVVNLSIQGDLFLNRVKEIDEQLGESEIKINVLNNIEDYVITRNRSSNTAPATLGLNDPVLVSLLNQLFQTEFEEEKIKQLSGEKNPQLVVIRESIEKLKTSILQSVRNLKHSLQQSSKKLKQEEARYSGLIKNIPQKERSLLDISRQQQIKNDIYTFLLQKREEAALAAASLVTNHRVIDHPETIGMIYPKKILIYFISIGVSIALSALIIFLKEFNNSNILYRDVLERYTSIPVIGEVVLSESGELIEANSSRRSIFVEQIREIRTNLSYFSINKTSGRTILFTSSIPGEGKSFLSLNLAASLAMAGKRVVILEFDLRKPKLSKPLGIKKNIGLSSYIIGHSLLKDIIFDVPNVKNLWILPCGPIPPNPTELIMENKVTELFTELQNNYDYVLIDAPPVGSVTDAKLLSIYSDIILYVVRQNFTPKDYLKFMKDINEKNIFSNLSIVFNGVNLKGFGYNYGYGYGLGYGYSDENKV